MSLSLISVQEMQEKDESQVKWTSIAPGHVMRPGDEAARIANCACVAIRDTKPGLQTLAADWLQHDHLDFTTLRVWVLFNTHFDPDLVEDADGDLA